jgi:maltose alpha-D-glucosyltransferase/alpha-amylase
VTAVNLSDEEVTCELADDRLTGLADVLSDREYPAPDDGPTKFQLAGYGYRWLRRRDEPFSTALEPNGE